MSEQKTILLVDGSNLVFRMYFALERTGMTSPTGKPSWAIFGFFKALLDVIQKYKPTAVVSAFDMKGPTFRHEASESYKANRPKEMPDALAAQWPEIRRGIDLIGMSSVQMQGFEADDLIGTLACKAQMAGWKVLILSGDKDNFQLVNDDVKVLMPGQAGGISEMGITQVKEKMGIYPEQVVDYKALRGDASDNIPGVPGIGEKTAIKLIEEYGSLQNIYANIDTVKPESVKRKLVEGRDSADDSRFLAEIKTDCEISYPFEQLTHKLTPNIPELIEFLKEYKLASLERRLPEIFQVFGEEENLMPALAAVSQPRQSYAKPAAENESGDEEFPFEEFEEKSKELEESKETLQFTKKTILSETELEGALNEALNADYIGFDLETDGLNTWECNIVGWALAWQKAEQKTAIYIPTGHQYLGAPSQLTNEFVREKFKQFFAETKAELYMQNAKFEYKVLNQCCLNLPSKFEDTMLASYLHNPDSAHGLKAQALQVFNYKMRPIEDLIGNKGKNQKTMTEVSVEEASDYACDDAFLTLALGRHYSESLPEKLKKLWTDIESPLAGLLARMELNGVYINKAKLHELSDEMCKQITSLEAQIIEELDSGPFNLNSSQQLGKALTAKGFKISKSTSSGQVSTDSKTLEELKEQDTTGLIDKIVEHRMLSKLRSTYTDSLAKQINPKTGRLHGEFNQALTSTGRLSSSNPNLQNIPVKNQTFGRLIRSCFEAEAGKALISADYSQIELRILAHYTQDPTLVDAFQKGQDIHLRTAAEIFEVPPEKVTSDMRRLGKTLNFALIYQQGTYATARQLGISNKKAAEFIEKYFLAFPKIRPFMEQTLTEARENGYVETLWGRRRYFTNLNASSALVRKAEERAAFNAPLQGTASDMMKIAMLRVEERISKESLDAQMVLQVHDEIVLEVAQEQAKQVEKLLKEEMPIGQPLLVPIDVQVSAGANWAECK